MQQKHGRIGVNPCLDSPFNLMNDQGSEPSQVVRALIKKKELVCKIMEQSLSKRDHVKSSFKLIKNNSSYGQ